MTLVRLMPVLSRCPPLLHILLRILECNLLASRSFWLHRVAERFFLASSNPAIERERTQSVSDPPPLIPITGETDHLTLKDLIRGKKFTNNGAKLGLKSIPGDEGSTAVATSQADTSGTAVPPIGGGGPLASEEECDRLRIALVTSQDATVVQLLLEFCLPSAEEKRMNSEVAELCEIRNILCNFIHYLFISDPNLANVVFWQTYPRSIIPVAARAIPSLHICMDSVVEVFRKSGDLKAAVFCIDFVSHLAMHYNIGLLLDRATYLSEAMYHIFTTIINVGEMPSLLLACGPAFCRLGCAFPSLGPRIASIFISCMSIMYGAVALSGGDCLETLSRHISRLTPDTTIFSTATPCEEFDNLENDVDYIPDLNHLSKTKQYYLACLMAMVWFNRLVYLISAQKCLYMPPTTKE